MMNKRKHIVLTHVGISSDFDNLRELGYTIHHFPMIRIDSILDVKPFDLKDFDYYIFTSKNASDSFFNLPFVKAQPANLVKALSIGNKTTKQLKKHHVDVIYTSGLSNISGFEKEIRDLFNLENKKIVHVTGNLSKAIILSANVNRIEVYKTTYQTNPCNTLKSILLKNPVVVFTSSSAFKAFSNVYDLDNLTLAAIGNSTANTIKKNYRLPDIIAEKPSYSALSEAIFSNHQLHYQTL